MKSTILFTTILVFAFGNISRVMTQTLDEGLKNLSSQIASEMAEGNKQKIAVIEFSDLDGKITELGKYLSEELITRLFMTKKFNVVERQLLNKIIEEHKLNLSGLIDETTAKELGKILGVDAICSGTITDLVNSIKINARLVSTETGSLFAVASTEIKKDETVRKLMESKLPNGKTENKKQILEDNQFFKEDFSNVNIGELPKEWTGGQNMMVSDYNGKKCLSFFQESEDYITIRDINYPKDFSIEFKVSGYGTSHLILSVGNVKLLFKYDRWNSYIQIGEIIKYMDLGTGWDREVIVSLKRQGALFKGTVDGVPIVTTSNREFQSTKSLGIEIRRSRNGGNGNFRIFKILGTTLSE